MSIISRKWKKTKYNYLDWLLKTELKTFFSKNIFYDKLSLWWLTEIYEKDALNDHRWYNNLNKIINGENKIESKKKINIHYGILKTFLKFLKTTILLIFIKILYPEKKSRFSNNKNCVHVQYSNLVKYKNNFIDTQYGLFSIKNDFNSLIDILSIEDSTRLLFKKSILPSQRCDP